MSELKKFRNSGKIWKVVACMALSTFYFAILAYPFGVTGEGFVVKRVLIAITIFFAISIPAWMVNLKRELLSGEEVEEEIETKTPLAEASDICRIAELAVKKHWLEPKEVQQILYCMRHDGKSFGDVAIKRNFLTMNQVNILLKTQHKEERESMARASAGV